MKKLTLRVAREDVGDQETYVVVCREHDIVSQGSTIGEAIQRFGLTWDSQAEVGAEEGMEHNRPENIKPPPVQVLKIFFGDLFA